MMLAYYCSQDCNLWVWVTIRLVEDPEITARTIAEHSELRIGQQPSHHVYWYTLQSWLVLMLQFPSKRPSG